MEKPTYEELERECQSYRTVMYHMVQDACDAQETIAAIIKQGTNREEKMCLPNPFKRQPGESTPLTATPMPEPPALLGSIEGSQLRALLEAIGLTNIQLGSYDYKLTSYEEIKRFLGWYVDRHPYKADDYDCNYYALRMHASFVEWAGGAYAFGHIWAESADILYPYPSHAFNIAIDNNHLVHYCDELEVAAPRDSLWEAYPVKSFFVEI